MQLSSTSLLNWIWEKIVLDKQLLRKIMKEKRLALTSQTFSLYNQQILSKVLTHPRVQEAKIIGCYVSLPREVDTLAIIQNLLLHKRVCVPKVEGSQMNFYEINSLDELHSGCLGTLIVCLFLCWLMIKTTIVLAMEKVIMIVIFKEIFMVIRWV